MPKIKDQRSSSRWLGRQGLDLPKRFHEATPPSRTSPHLYARREWQRTETEPVRDMLDSVPSLVCVTCPESKSQSRMLLSLEALKGRSQRCLLKPSGGPSTGGDSHLAIRLVPATASTASTSSACPWKGISTGRRGEGGAVRTEQRRAEEGKGSGKGRGGEVHRKREELCSGFDVPYLHMVVSLLLEQGGAAGSDDLRAVLRESHTVDGPGVLEGGEDPPAHDLPDFHDLVVTGGR
eukprot:760634-Hanusia_phi.AAC.2